MGKGPDLVLVGALVRIEGVSVAGRGGLFLELVRLVVHVGRNRAELVSVFPGVVSAEEQFTAGDSHFAQLVVVLPCVVGTEEQLEPGGELNTKVGLSAATVATVKRRHGGGTGGNCSSHFGLSFYRCPVQRAKMGIDSLIFVSPDTLIKP